MKMSLEYKLIDLQIKLCIYLFQMEKNKEYIYISNAYCNCQDFILNLIIVSLDI